MSDKKIFGSMINKLKESPKTIVFTEGTDPRILEAASRLLKEQLMKPVLLQNFFRNLMPAWRHLRILPIIVIQ